MARRTYERLGDADRGVLDAYARARSAGFAEPGVAQGDAFLVADVVPAAWQPWDALAVERLHAYLAAPAPSADSTWIRAAVADSAVAAFVRADSLFRDFLGFPGGGYDRTYALDRAPGGRALVQQTSAGTSANDFLAPAVLKTPQRTAVALTVPGTLVSVTGWSGGLGWGLLLGSDLRLEPYGGPAPLPMFSRIVERDGDETLLSVARDSTGLVLRAGRDRVVRTDSARADSTRRPAVRPAPVTAAADTTARDSTAATGWRVLWSGFGLGTDLGAFRALRAGRVPAAFVLLDGGGLAVTADGTRLLGAPPVATASGGVAFVAQDSLARWAAVALRPAAPRRTARPDSLAEVLDVDTVLPNATGDLDLMSGWARARLPGLVAALGARDSLPDVLQASYSYLKSWDGAYRADGIAPSLFEWWMVSHRDVTGHLPDPADSLDAALLPSTLRIARAELRDRFGPLPTEWRWGRLQGRPRYPVLGGSDGAAARRFREPLPPPGGHPTSPLPGPSLVFPEARPGLAVWSVHTRLRDGRTEIQGPTRRPPPTGVLDLGASSESEALVLDPTAPTPSARLTLRPRP